MDTHRPGDTYRGICLQSFPKPAQLCSFSALCCDPRDRPDRTLDVERPFTAARLLERTRSTERVEPKAMAKNRLPADHRAELLTILKQRFEENTERHKGVKWSDVSTRLEANEQKLWSLAEMERTGGEPDVVAFDKKTGEYVFYDCAEESPKGRRSLCYDGDALESRKEHKPKSSAVDMAALMGVDLLTEVQYRDLQMLGEFDTKTSSWVRTPLQVRELGGAIFCDRRFGRVFTYHNGAESYYAARGFRASVRV